MEDLKIYEAAGCNDVAFVKEALEGKFGEQLKDDLELALHMAATNGHLDCLTLLLEHKVSVHARNGSEETALMLAAQGDHVTLVSKLLERGANVHDQNCMGYTALMKACEFGHIRTVELLLKHGASVSPVEHGGDEHHGIPNGLPNGSAKNLLPKYMPHGYTALMILVLKQPDNFKKILKLLLEANMPVNEMDLENTTVLLHAATKCTADVIEMLLEAGAEVNTTDVWGVTPVMSAAGYNKTDNVKVLLRYGADVSISCKAKRTVLSVAARTGSEELINIILEAGADPEHKDAHGRTPLFIAIMHYNYAGIKCLIRAGCDLTVSCRDMTTFQVMSYFECALSRKSVHMIDMLFKAGACSNKDIFEVSTDEKFKEQCADKPEIFILLNKMLSTPKCLRYICRKGIRDCIVKPLPRSVSFLSLPKSLKDYLLYSDIILPVEEI
ncbi:ankyrin repeat and SOCS box protein 13-like [Mercenaria mercenaria]|uniref:ankyrin repeat and SOCS box protein 13-like n=1 Tax=Mercenaria mercenaria TaxID=6596 RepID=UPI00234FA21D|nr:ankyrin repeat and SOCS box protein 13-like [Mercenaria mercenaria]